MQDSSQSQGVVGGLSDVLLALGDELRSANRKVGEWSGVDQDGTPFKQPILFLAGASVELSVAVEAKAGGGLNIWVVKADGAGGVERTARVTVQLNTDGALPMGG